MKAQVMINEDDPMTMNVIREGKGELFTDVDPDHAREIFRQKPRKMVNKVMQLTKAIETFVHDGDYWGWEGLVEIEPRLPPVMRFSDRGGNTWDLPGIRPPMISRS